MDKIELKIIGLSSSQSQSGSFALVLGESEGKRRLPIIIGMFEAQAIAIEIENIIPNRPMTHDLFKTFAEVFKFNIIEIVISDLNEGVFYAKIVCEDDKGTYEIDSRPSDAIAIGLRFNAPIYTYEKILNEAGIEFSESEEQQTRPPSSSGPPTGEPAEEKPFMERLKDFSVEKLKKMLEEAIEKEDYEKAAKIRDEINNRN